MLTKTNVLLNIFNVLLIIFLCSIIYGQNTKIENNSFVKPYFNAVSSIHNNIRQKNTIVKTELNNTNEQTIVENENIISSFIHSINESLLSNDDKENEQTFDFKNVENDVVQQPIVDNNQTLPQNNLDKTLEIVTQNLNLKKDEPKVEPKVEDKDLKKPDLTETKNIDESHPKKNDSKQKIILNMKDNSKDVFQVKKTIKTKKRINLYTDIDIISSIKLVGDSEIFVSKQVYDGMYKIMINNKVYLINENNVDLTYIK